jgi:hypothetical protein
MSDGRPFSSDAKAKSGSTASMDIDVDRGGGAFLVMRAPPVSS